MSKLNRLLRPRVAQNIHRRHRKDRRFKAYATAAVFLIVAFIGLLMAGLLIKGLPAFKRAEIGLDISFETAASQNSYSTLDTNKLIMEALRDIFPKISEEELLRTRRLLSPGAGKILFRALKTENTSPKQKVRLWIPAADDADAFLKNRKEHQIPERFRRLDDALIKRLDQLEEKGLLRISFNSRFLMESDARDPEFAGLFGALKGSLCLLFITLSIGFPLGVGTAIYLEEFSKKSRLAHLIEVNISNLAAVPSIIFGLLGLAVFLNMLSLPRSSTLVGGLTLSLMTLPIIIISTRTALRTVPKAIRMAAFGLGASQMQVVFHHVLPAALPGIATGTLLGLARALGETAPLLMIGMMAYIGSPPGSPLDPSSALPVQIFTWSRNPEPGFLSNAAGAILILIGILFVLNLGALYIRKKFERKW